MSSSPDPLQYQSKGDAVADDVRSMRRSFRTWVVLWMVWGVGLVVWAGYLALVAYLVLRALT